jgi:polyisoprenoid-binding protein YceI
MQKIVFLLLISCPLFGQNQIDFNQFYPIDRGHSFVEFSIRYMGYASVKGRFSDFSGLVRYDEQNPALTSVSLSIKSESINTDLTFRDNDLKSANWFDVKKFPTITFTSKGIKNTGTGFEVIGDLTIKGVTKQVVLNMDPPSGVLKDVRDDLQVIFTGQTKIDRTEFGVEGKNWSGVKEGITAVSNEVKIEFSILGKRLRAANYANRVKNDQAPSGKVYKVVKEHGVQQGLETFKTIKETADRNVLHTVGYMLQLEGNLKDAMAIFEANRDAYPEEPEVYYALGEAHALQGESAQAKGFFEQAIRKNPEYVQAAEALRHYKD